MTCVCGDRVRSASDATLRRVPFGKPQNRHVNTLMAARRWLAKALATARLRDCSSFGRPQCTLLSFRPSVASGEIYSLIVPPLPKGGGIFELVRIYRWDFCTMLCTYNPPLIPPLHKWGTVWVKAPLPKGGGTHGRCEGVAVGFGRTNFQILLLVL